MPAGDSVELVSTRRSTLAERYGKGLKDPVAERPNHSDLCTSEFVQNSVRIQENSQNFSEILKRFKTSQHFLECAAKFREKIIKIGANFDESW